MFFLIIGIVAFALKLAGVTPLASLHWWWFSVPFALAIVWWKLSDALGLTQRMVMKRLLQRKLRRREEAMEALGMKPQQAHRLASVRARSGGAEAAEPGSEKPSSEASGSEARAERNVR